MTNGVVRCVWSLCRDNGLYSEYIRHTEYDRQSSWVDAVEAEAKTILGSDHVQSVLWGGGIVRFYYDPNKYRYAGQNQST